MSMKMVVIIHLSGLMNGLNTQYIDALIYTKILPQAV